MTEPNQPEIKEAIEHLLGKVASVQLATSNEDGEPEASYTPYLWKDQCAYIFVSELAAHTKNLKNSQHASLMFIEDEADSKNVFARQRLILSCQAEFIDREAEEWKHAIHAFEQRHGNTVSLLKTLKDFWLVRLCPDRGSFVRGFGQAFAFTEANFDQAQQVTGK